MRGADAVNRRPGIVGADTSATWETVFGVSRVGFAANSVDLLGELSHDHRVMSEQAAAE